MLHNRNHIAAFSLLAFMIVASGREAAAEEYVWKRFYGSYQPSGYATDGFGSYYVPKSMAASNLQTDPIKKPVDPKPAAKKPAKTKSADPVKSTEPVVEAKTPKPAPPTSKSFWKRLTFRK